MIRDRQGKRPVQTGIETACNRERNGFLPIGPPTDMVIDENYAELCSWADIQTSGNVMPKELTDIAVSLWENVETREQRKKQNKLEPS